MRRIILPSILILATLITGCSDNPKIREAINRNMQGLDGTFVLLDIDSDKSIVFNSDMAAERTTPCSTFKIWNTLVGIENGLISSGNDPFYRWDGVERSMAEWNRDLTFSEAFTVSCVPAFQALAVRIGPEKMQEWLTLIGYGDQDISSGIDDFWLSRQGKKSIKISPVEQVRLLGQLMKGQLPFSEKSTTLLFKVLLARETPRGKMYGKTGSGCNVDDIGGNDIGWYVGYVVTDKKRYAFACLIRHKGVSGREAKAIVERILIESGLL